MQSRHSQTSHPSARHTRIDGCSSLSVQNSRNVVDSTLCFVRTADDVERATSLRTYASIRVGVRMLVLIRSSTPETFPDTSMSLSLWRLHFVLAS